MKHEITSLNTKKTLAASFKKIVSEKPFSKVTISDIINDCGVNRKTFYYHFQDIYSLLTWMLEQEAINVVKRFDLTAEYKEAISFVMDYVEQNHDFLQNIYHSLGREELKRFFYLDFITIVESLVGHVAELMHVHITDDFQQFLCRFYTEALAGILLDWIISYNTRDREDTIRYIETILRASIPTVLQEGERLCCQ